MGALGTGVQTCALPIYDVDPQLGVHHRAQCISDDIDLGCGFSHAVTAARFLARRARANPGPVARFQTATAPAPPATAAPRPNRAGVALSTPDRARANPPAARPRVTWAARLRNRSPNSSGLPPVGMRPSMRSLVQTMNGTNLWACPSRASPSHAASAITSPDTIRMRSEEHTSALQ